MYHQYYIPSTLTVRIMYLCIACRYITYILFVGDYMVWKGVHPRTLLPSEVFNAVHHTGHV